MADDAIARLEAAALKAREFTHSIDDRSYTLRVPTRHEARQCVHRHGLGSGSGGAMLVPLLKHYLLLQHLVGWTGVRERHLVPQQDGAAPVPWSPRAVALLLDALPDDADALGQALLERADQRDQGIEVDAKNSQPASSVPEAPTQASPNLD